jgi:hypothetical protein
MPASMTDRGEGRIGPLQVFPIHEGKEKIAKG